jgi:hypothetical protein
MRIFTRVPKMKRIVASVAAVLSVSTIAVAQTGVVSFPIGTETSEIRGEAALAGPVTDAEKALAVARPILVSIYGKQHIQREEPLIASRKEDVWFIEGSMHCPDLRAWWEKFLGDRPMCLGGTAELKLSAKTGAVLLVTHYQ